MNSIYVVPFVAFLTQLSNTFYFFLSFLDFDVLGILVIDIL